MLRVDVREETTCGGVCRRWAQHEHIEGIGDRASGDLTQQGSPVAPYSCTPPTAEAMTRSPIDPASHEDGGKAFAIGRENEHFGRRHVSRDVVVRPRSPILEAFVTPASISPISQFRPIAKEHPEEPVWPRKDCIRELAHTLRHQEVADEQDDRAVIHEVERDPRFPRAASQSIRARDGRIRGEA